MAGRTLVVSAANLLRRGFEAVAPDRHSDAGEPVNALLAVARALGKAMALKRPDRAVAVIEAASADWPALLEPQRARLPAFLEAHGLTVVHAESEPNVVASYVQAALDDGDDVVVLGSDKRFAQLVEARVWWYDAYKDARYTAEMVEKRFCVPPPKVAQWLALVGDDDALAGIKGIGKKGATDLLEAHGTVEAALEQLDSLGSRTRNALRAAIDQIPGALALAALERRRVVPVAVQQLDFTPPPQSQLNALYNELGFLELLSSVQSAPLDVAVCTDELAMQAALTELGAGPIAVHAVTEDPSPVRGALVGLALSAGRGEALYFPKPELLAPWLEDPAVPKIGHDLKAAVVALARRDMHLLGIVGDTACASHLSEPSNHAPHDLPTVARQILRRPLPEDDAVLGVGGRRRQWAALAPERVAGFAGAYADAAAAAWHALEPDVDRALLDEYLALSDTLVRMELRGLAVDAAELAQAGEDFVATEAELEREIYELASRSFNLASSKQLGSVLFEDLDLPVLKRTKTGWSTATEALERIQHAHPIVPLVIRWRRLRRLRSTWITALLACIDGDGRVRSSFHPARSFSGRLVNSNPDLGRVPGRTFEMQRIRRAFVAPAGSVLLSLDYVQLGLYVLAHLTKDPALVEPLSQKLDMHTLTAAAVLELPEDAIGKDERQTGKVVNFATFAGQGASSLALQLGVTAQEAKTLIARFDRRYAVVRAFQDEQLRLAKTRGYVLTLAGRRWPIGGLQSLDLQARAYAERLARRATHEASVADVSRRGLLVADQALRAAGLSAAPLLQIHDEMLFEVPESEVEAAIEVAAEAMIHAFELEVPLRLGVKVGPNWADLEPRDAAY